MLTPSGATLKPGDTLSFSAQAFNKAGTLIPDAKLPMQEGRSPRWRPNGYMDLSRLKQDTGYRAKYEIPDAVAAWFFDSYERERGRLAEFDSLAAASENDALAEFLRGELREGRLKDDDVAIVRIKVVGA